MQVLDPVRYAHPFISLQTETSMHANRLLLLTGPSFLLCILMLWVTPAIAQRASGQIGIGAQIGDPSGVSVLKYNPHAYSYDFLAAWDNDDFFFLNVHLQREKHLDHTPNVHLFYGPGGFVGFYDNRRDDDLVMGISGRFGLGYMFDQWEVFAQLTPRFSLIPATDGEVGGGLGIRYYLR